MEGPASQKPQKPQPLPPYKILDLSSLHRGRPSPETVAVAIEQHALTGTLGVGARLDPLAHAGAAPESTDEPDRTSRCVGSVVLAHDGLDRLGCLVGIVKGNGADVVVENVRLNDAVEQVSTNESKLTIHSSGSTTDKVPLVIGVMWEGRVGVLEESDGHYGTRLVHATLPSDLGGL